MLEVRAEHGDRKIEIKLDDNNEQIQKVLISSFIDFLLPEQVEAVTTEIHISKEEKKLESLKEGYQAFKKEEGLHHPKSEFETEEATRNPHGTDFTLGKKVVDGEERFQTFYRCTQCSTKGKYYLPKGRIYCTCKECGKRMRIREAAANGNQDEFGNYYIAGDFKRSMYDKEQDEKFEKTKNIV